jgi:hypothetical protein
MYPAGPKETSETKARITSSTVFPTISEGGLAVRIGVVERAPTALRKEKRRNQNTQ